MGQGKEKVTLGASVLATPGVFCCVEQKHIEEIELVRRAQAGDRAAFDQLAGRYRAALRAMAFLRTSDREAAQDLAQETLLRAWDALPSLREPGAFLPWLKRIAAHEGLSWHRPARFVTLPLDGDIGLRLPADIALQPLEVLLARERQRAMRQALASLPDANRVALLMHVWEGASYEEIAAFTSVAVSTVEGRLYRARKQLRRLLHEDEAALTGRPARRWDAADDKGEDE
ncbi:MAG: RNA polymerase sigma factor [Armatimonadota bacterium]|nr:RNA polymerase sigma factor [Armatimonadota bacterium]